jgi:tRNA(Ile)-lysidine synthetase-like protein
VEHIRRLLEAGKSGKVVQIPGGIVAAREFDSLVIRSALDSTPPFEYELQIPGVLHIPELGRVFRAEIVDREMILSGDRRVFVDGGSLGPYVRIRNWRPGDYYRPVGLAAGKLKKLFQQARIPRSQRGRWPVFVNDSAIVWVASFPVSREFAPCGRTQKIIALEAVPEIERGNRPNLLESAKRQSICSASESKVK